jgi:hypothetical protein
MKYLYKIAVSIICLFINFANGQNIHLYYGNTNMTAYIGEELLIPVSAYS